MAHGDADAVEAQGLEVQELGLGPALVAADKNQAPIGRLMHFSSTMITPQAYQ
jgi:hypothetical protein